MSSNPKKIKTVKNENDSNFNVEISDKSSDDKQIFDLNEIFHIDLSYNFDLLKNLLSTIIKNQKLKDDKILDLENQILDLRIAFNENPEREIEIEKKPEKKKGIKSKPTVEENLENVDEVDLTYELKPSKKEPILEESEKYQPIVNKIIVRI